MSDESLIIDLARACGRAVARGVGGEACADFERFADRTPSAHELVEWCPEVYDWIATQPLNMENDRDGLFALEMVSALATSLMDTLRDDFVSEFWRSYSEATGHDVECNGIDHFDVA